MIELLHRYLFPFQYFHLLLEKGNRNKKKLKKKKKTKESFNIPVLQTALSFSHSQVHPAYQITNYKR